MLERFPPAQRMSKFGQPGEFISGKEKPCNDDYIQKNRQFKLVQNPKPDTIAFKIMRRVTNPEHLLGTCHIWMSSLMSFSFYGVNQVW